MGAPPAGSPPTSEDARDGGARESDLDSLRVAPRPVFVAVPGGEAVVGCARGDRDCFADESPSRRVRLSAFELAATETTRAQYAACVRAGICPSTPGVDLRGADRAEHPVTDVSWSQAAAYCAWIDGRLPTRVFGPRLAAVLLCGAGGKPWIAVEPPPTC